MYIPPFLTSALYEGERSASQPAWFTPGERSYSTHWIEHRVVPREGLDAVKQKKFFTHVGH
jgi:hypothetical protein